MRLVKFQRIILGTFLNRLTVLFFLFLSIIVYEQSVSVLPAYGVFAFLFVYLQVTAYSYAPLNEGNSEYSIKKTLK